MGSIRLTASGLYQFSTKGAQHTRLGNRFQGGIALSHRFGPAPHVHAPSHNHHHGDELDEHHEHAHSSWDGFVELGGEWEARQKIGGQIEEASGGKWAWVAPGFVSIPRPAGRRRRLWRFPFGSASEPRILTTAIG
jgi:hypothetical protein